MTQHRTREEQIEALAGEVGPEKTHGPEMVRRMWAAEHIIEAEQRASSELQAENERLREAITRHRAASALMIKPLECEEMDCVLHAALGRASSVVAGRSDRERLAGVPATVVQQVAELPDRSSPDDAPDMMQVSSEELADIVRAAIDTAMDREGRGDA